jgi:hypothetical protein
MSSERGSGAATVLIACGLLSAFFTVLGAVVMVTAVVSSQHAVEQAALLAVDAAVGRAPGVPCDRARGYLAEHGYFASRCAIDGYESRIEMAISVGAFNWSVRAHAGLESSSP